MMIMKFERVNVQMERLEDMEGFKRKTISIPDYIDSKFSEANNKLLKSEPSPLIKGSKKIRNGNKLKKFSRTNNKKGKRSKKTASIDNND